MNRSKTVQPSKTAYAEGNEMQWHARCKTSQSHVQLVYRLGRKRNAVTLFPWRGAPPATAALTAAGAKCNAICARKAQTVLIRPRGKLMQSGSRRGNGTHSA